MRRPRLRAGDGRAIWPALAAGVVLAAGQAPLSLSYVALAALVAVFALLDRAPGPRAAALTGWAAGAGYFAAGLFWIVEPFFVDPWRHAWLSPFALVLLPGGLALFWALAFGLAARLAQGWRRVMLGAVLLAAVEMSRAYVLTGFPWALVGYMWIDAPQMQLAAVIGPHGLTLATCLAAAGAALALGRPRAWLAVPALALAGVAGAGLWGAARLATPMPDPGGTILRLVQPNAEQRLKWDPDLAQDHMARLLTATAAPAEGEEPDLFIWPETAVPYLLNGSEALLAQVDFAALGRPVVFGVVRRDDERLYNSLAVTAPGGTVAQLYDKHHLVPFGEYLPFGDALAHVGIYAFAASHGGGFSAGPGPALLDFGTAGKALALICYEAIFPQNLRAAERPDWVLQATNDAWFGDISGPYQHLAQARMRAVEQGLPVIRAANTGISAVIDARGQVTGSLGLGVQGILDAALPAPLPPTPYSRTGDWPVLVLLAALTLMLSAPSLRKTH